MVPFQSNCHHGTWNWFYHFGTGDFGNDGVHDIDYARWGLGVETHPNAVTALGGKYFFDDDQQFPDTQQVTFEYTDQDVDGGRKMLIYEQRLWSTNYPHNCDSGVEFYGTKGLMFLSRRGKVEVRGPRNAKIDFDSPGEPQDAEAHVANFLAGIRQGAPLNAEIEVGHRTTTLCHLGNLAVRLGRTLRFDPAEERFLNDDEANALVARQYRTDHWGAPAGV
jgi:predicted dehydrogenase